MAERLSARFGKGFRPRTLRRIRQFYLTYPDGSACTAALNIDAIWPAALSESSSDAIWSALLAKSPGTAHRLIFPPTLGWSHMKSIDDDREGFIVLTRFKSDSEHQHLVSKFLPTLAGEFQDESREFAVKYTVIAQTILMLNWNDENT